MSVNTRETAFDLTVDDEGPSKLTGESPARANRADLRMQRGAAFNVKRDTIRAQQDVYEFENSGQPERSQSVSSKRRTTPLTKASPVQGDLGRSVAFRPPPHVSKVTPKDDPSKSSEPGEEDPTYETSTENASQKALPGSLFLPSLATVNRSSSTKSGRSSRDAHGELTPNLFRTVHTGSKSAAGVNPKRGYANPVPISKDTKRTLNPKKPPSGAVAGLEPLQPTVSAPTNGSERSGEGTLSAVEAPTADFELSAVAHHDRNIQNRRPHPPPVHQQECNDKEGGTGSACEREPGARMVETGIIGDPMNGTRASRSASGAENDPSQGTRKASIPPRSMNITVKDEPTERQTSSLRPDQARVASPTLQTSEFPADTASSSANPSGEVADCTTTVAAAMVAGKTLRSNEAGGFATVSPLDLRNTISEYDMEQCMRRYLKELYDNHDYFMKV